MQALGDPVDLQRASVALPAISKTVGQLMKRKLGVDTTLVVWHTEEKMAVENGAP